MSYNCPECGCALLKKPWTFKRAMDNIGIALIIFVLGALASRWFFEVWMV